MRAYGGLPYPFGFVLTVMVYRISSFERDSSGEVGCPGGLFQRGRTEHLKKEPFNDDYIQEAPKRDEAHGESPHEGGAPRSEKAGTPRRRGRNGNQKRSFSLELAG